MSELKCPLCQQEVHITEWESANSEAYCSHCDTTGDLKLWQELIRTRKALDVAKWWLKEIVESHRYTPISTAEMALKEITALEQKE